VKATPSESPYSGWRIDGFNGDRRVYRGETRNVHSMSSCIIWAVRKGSTRIVLQRDGEA